MSQVEIQRGCAATDLPSDADFAAWVAAALGGQRENGEVSIRLVDAAESAELNQRYRDKSGPTNVLSFPAELPAELDLPLLGDLVICAPVVLREAAEQGKTARAHWAHMVVHGTLHLLGFDHQTDAEAAVMEGLETRILTALDFPPPYAA